MMLVFEGCDIETFQSKSGIKSMLAEKDGKVLLFCAGKRVVQKLQKAGLVGLEVLSDEEVFKQVAKQRQDARKSKKVAIQISGEIKEQECTKLTISLEKHPNGTAKKLFRELAKVLPFKL